MSSESFDIKFSRVACVLFELRHLAPQNISKSPQAWRTQYFSKIFLQWDSEPICTLFEYVIWPPKIFQSLPRHEELNIFQRFFCNGILSRFAPCKSYKLRACEKKCRNGTPYCDATEECNSWIWQVASTSTKPDGLTNRSNIDFICFPNSVVQYVLFGCSYAIVRCCVTDYDDIFGDLRNKRFWNADYCLTSNLLYARRITPKRVTSGESIYAA